MKLLRRNLTPFEYRARTGMEEQLVDGLHTGVYTTAYASPVLYYGNISVPSGYTQNGLFGINTDYTHVLVMENTGMVDIREDGLIDWKGDTYEIQAVRPSMNYISVALKIQTADRTGG